jgi:hypothetical protein
MLRILRNRLPSGSPLTSLRPRLGNPENPGNRQPAALTIPVPKGVDLINGFLAVAFGVPDGIVELAEHQLPQVDGTLARAGAVGPPGATEADSPADPVQLGLEGVHQGPPAFHFNPEPPGQLWQPGTVRRRVAILPRVPHHQRR